MLVQMALKHPLLLAPKLQWALALKHLLALAQKLQQAQAELAVLRELLARRLVPQQLATALTRP
jgi:hypothetical protein